LENSLNLAQMDQRGLVLESVDLKKLISRLHTQWPGLKIQLQGKTLFLADSMAMESILKNLISNSLLHGLADEIFLKLVVEKNTVLVFYSDNSEVALARPPEELGKKLEPSQKGSGLGLYIVRHWMNLQKANIRFLLSNRKTLQVEMQFSLAKEIV
jgi:signal transduction histidine kinase